MKNTRPNKQKAAPKRRRRYLPFTAAAGALLVVVAAVLLVSSWGGDESAALTVDTGGRIQVAETSFDFGSVPVDQQVQHEFEVKNTGTGTLQLGELSVKRLEGC